jgi:hypothetical protein
MPKQIERDENSLNCTVEGCRAFFNRRAAFSNRNLYIKWFHEDALFPKRRGVAQTAQQRRKKFYEKNRERILECQARQRFEKLVRAQWEDNMPK